MNEFQARNIRKWEYRSEAMRALRRLGRTVGEPMAAVPGWSFAKETIFVTRLGIGSADCLRVPVSVSCLPTKAITVEESAVVIKQRRRKPSTGGQRAFGRFVSLADWQSARRRG